MVTIGPMIREKRKELGLSQDQLAEKIGKTAGYVGQLEREQSSPSYPTLKRLVDVLDLDVLALFYPVHHPDQNVILQQQCISAISKLSARQQQLILGIMAQISKYNF